MRTGELLGSGRTADVYALADDGWVLRRYRPGSGLADAATIAAEAALMAHLAAYGFPVPEVRPTGAAGELLVRRLAGPTLLDALLAGRVDAEEGAAVLAALLRRLHAVPPRPGAAPGTRLLHLDLHPGNVLLDAAGTPYLIDWSTAQDGPPALDWALTALILAEAATGPYPLARALLDALLTGAPPDLAAALPRAEARRAANPTQSPAQLAALPDAVALVRDALDAAAR
jgi:aminoglycoside phosphotransferase (APT) family kinase protein